MGLETYSLNYGFQAAESGVKKNDRNLGSSPPLTTTPTHTPSFLCDRKTNASKSDAISLCQVLNIVPNKIA